MNGSHPILDELHARFDADTVTVYQAYSWSIAGPAMKAQAFVAPFRLSRMTWIKPSFLWMMHRSSWASSPGQEHVLAIDLPRERWEEALAQAVLSTPVRRLYPDKARWRKAVEASAVRVQWDPDYDLQDVRQPRRAIQVGIRPPLIAEYAKWPVRIRDLTQEVHATHALVRAGRLAEASERLPVERAYPLSAALRRVLGMSPP